MWNDLLLKARHRKTLSMTNYKSDFMRIMDERGFIHQGSHLDSLDERLCEGKIHSAYIGFDATAKSLHIGNLTGIMMLYWFQQTGHKPITLMGGGTSKVGDPSFKDKQRKLLDDETIEENIEHIKKTCFRQFLKYGDGETDALMVNNNDWLNDLKYLDFLRDYGRFFTINRMISFESVSARLERESPLTLLEFNYMVMQGYDFFELNRQYGTILQMGGSDQWGNIINGVELTRKYKNFHKGITEMPDNEGAYWSGEGPFALTAPLLTTPDGKKMGKTENGAVWLNADMLSPYDYYQYWRNVDDVTVPTLLRRFTILPMDEIAKLEALQGAEINEAKKVLAFEATKLCHGERAATEAAATAQATFEQGGVGEDLPEIAPVFDGGQLDLVATVSEGFDVSKREARQRIEQGGVRIDNEKVESFTLPMDSAALDAGVKLSFGKKKHGLLKAPT